MKRLLLLLGLITALLVPAPMAVADKAAAQTPPTPQTSAVEAPAGARRAPLAVTAKIHHYNMCNAWDGDPCTKAQADNAVNLLRFLSVGDGAWFISINEICEGTFVKLAADLGVAGTMVHSKEREPDCGNKPYGNAILHPGGVLQDTKVWFFPTQTVGLNCADPGTECRTGLCLKLGTFAGPMAMCTGHLGAGTMDRTWTESAEYAFIARSFVEPGRRLVLAGDFNLATNEVHDVYDGMADLVLGNTFDTRDGLVKKIDHIFIERVGTWTAKQAFCTDAAKVASDHCYTSGEWHL
jgi:endonuclease/exonuclease/phosphatase family metal-dependent hydrolase